jgi:hypothetical protein
MPNLTLAFLLAIPAPTIDEVIVCVVDTGIPKLEAACITRAAAVSLKDIFAKNKIPRVDFLKMDCEGAEYEILFNCQENILRKIDKIVIECHNTDKNKRLLSLKKFLEDNKFRAKILYGDKNSMTMSAPMLYAKK